MEKSRGAGFYKAKGYKTITVFVDKKTHRDLIAISKNVRQSLQTICQTFLYHGAKREMKSVNLRKTQNWYDKHSAELDKIRKGYIRMGRKAIFETVKTKEEMRKIYDQMEENQKALSSIYFGKKRVR